MKNKFENIEDLIAAHFAGETSKGDEQFLRDWLRSDQNQAYYNVLEKIYLTAPKAEKHFNTDAAWNKVVGVTIFPFSLLANP